MSPLIGTIIKFVPIDRRRALAEKEGLPEYVTGSVLFADISGFSALTNFLLVKHGPKRGAEEVLHRINPVYDLLIDVVHGYQGSVINFAGDSVTCWFNGDDGRQGVACALAMQEAVKKVPPVAIADAEELKIAVKVAGAAGPVRRFLVGNPDIQIIDILAGKTVDRMAMAEKLAEQGEVVVDQAIASVLGAGLQIVDWRFAEGSEHQFAVVAKTNFSVKESPGPARAADSLTVAQIRPWLLPVVFERLQSGPESLLAELRSVVVLFLRFEGLDYDHDEAVTEKLDAFVSRVQGILAQYEGTLLQVTTGDKGSYLYAAFGAPLAHDDDPDRAIAAAFALQSLADELPFITGAQMGISKGQLWTGAYGSKTRCTYGALGNETNIAARLMMKAKPGQILISAHIVAATEKVDVGAPEKIEVKGVEKLVPVYTALKMRKDAAPGPLRYFEKPLVGREEVLAHLTGFLPPAGEGQGQVIRLEGEAGMGKSHLTAVFCREAMVQGWQTAVGGCESVQTGVYRAWRPIIRSLLAISGASAAGQIEQLSEALAGANPNWLLRLPLLGDLLGLPIPDNNTTALLDPQSRREALWALVIDLVRMRAHNRPLLLLLEDVHWIDEGSAQLTLALARAIQDAPVLLILTQRPPLPLTMPVLPELSQLTSQQRLILPELPPAATGAIVERQLGGAATPLALALIQAKARGNPFFLREVTRALREAGQLERGEKGLWTLAEPVVAALREAGCLGRRDGEWRLVDEALLTAVTPHLPDTIHNPVLARMDRLPETQRMTLKVASVIGHSVARDVLTAMLRKHIGAAAGREALAALAERDFLQRASPSVYLFKHSIIHEVAYNTMPFEQRRDLHRAVAAWYERSAADAGAPERLTLDAALAPHYANLAHHWRHAENRERERIYAGLAGEQAAAQYANDEAARYLSRALTLTPAEDEDGRYKLLTAREAVYDRLGAREAQESDLADLAALAASSGDHARQARVSLRRAFYARAVSQHPQALALIEQAIAQANRGEAMAVEIKSYQLWGSILWQQGDYQSAKMMQELAMRLAETAGEQEKVALSLYNIGLIHYYQADDYDAAQAKIDRAQIIYREMDNRRGLVNCLFMSGSIANKKGYYGIAHTRYEEALAFCREIGWRHGETFILNSLGNNYFELGDYALCQTYHEKVRQICRELSDREGEAVSLDTLGLAAHRLGDDAAAQKRYQQAVTIQQVIGDRHGEAYTLTHWGYTLAERGEWEAARTRFEGALALRRELGEEALAQDDLAGLAWVALAQNDLTTAVAGAEEVLAWMEVEGVEGIEFPVQVYLICYRVLRAAASPSRAQAALQQGHSLLQRRAAGIQDERLRRRFLENVPFNREIVAAWESQP